MIVTLLFRDLRKERGAKTDRPGADHQCATAPEGHRSANGVSTDGQKLDRRRLDQRQAVGGKQVLHRHQDLLAHGAVTVYAKHLDRDAAVRLALAAGVAHVRRTDKG